jgi:HEAT repeat protein
LLTLSSLALTGCGGDSDVPSPDAPQAAAPQVTQPYDVREGNVETPTRPAESPFQLMTATEPVDSGAAATKRSSRPTIESYEDWTLSETAARALGRMGSAAVPELSRSLSDANPVMRRRAAEILAQIGPEAKDAVPALTRALDDRDPEVRKAAARALGEIGPDAKDAVPHLIEALREPGWISENETR